MSEAEVDARLERDAVGASGIEVLLSEIIIPAPPPQAAQAEATALAISAVTTEAAFEQAAREVSAVPSRERGGRLIAVVCVNAAGAVLMPCGRCRQLLWEHGGPHCLVQTPGGIEPMSNVLPSAFDAADLTATTDEGE